MATGATKNQTEEPVDVNLTPQYVICHMKDVSFQINTHWMLFLRLLGFPFTFDKVEECHRKISLDYDIELILEDSLDEWLKNTDGSSSWDKVQQAMKDLKKYHHATVVFQLYKTELTERLYGCESRHILLKKFEAEHIYNADNDDTTDISYDDRIVELISCAIKEDPNKLHNLVNILRNYNDENLNELSNNLDRECRRCNLGPPALPRRHSSTHKPIPLSPTLETSLTEIIEIEFPELLHYCIKLIVDAYSSKDNGLNVLKSYLERLPICGRDILTSDSIEAMVTLFVTKNNSVLKLRHLNNLLKECLIDSGLEEVKKFKKKVDSECEKVKSNQIISKRLRHIDLDECETIKFTVAWEVHETTVKDIEQLLTVAFEHLGCDVHVVTIKRGNSIIITCYAPEAIIGLLIFNAQKRLFLLKNKGVMSLKIGYCTLLDHKKNFEINKPLSEELEELWKEKQRLLEEIFDAKAELKNINLEIEGTEGFPRTGQDIKRTEEYTPVVKEKKEEKTIKANLYIEIEKLKGEIRSLQSKLEAQEIMPNKPAEISQVALKQALESRVPILYLHSKVIYPPLDITMSAFSLHKKRKEHWFSPSFYSHAEGYNMCLKLRPSGQEEGEGTHLSAYIHIMSGTYDHRLSWPFNGIIKLQLLNQRADSNHIDENIVIDESSDILACERVMGGLKTESGIAASSGVGIAKLISHDNLSYNPTTETEYLKDDAVFIRIKEVVINERMSPTSFTSTASSKESRIPIAEFKLPNYSKLRKKNEKWKSEPFYTLPPNGGYKFLMAVFTNGKDKFVDKSISVYTHLLKGENDDKLSFPFRDVITVQLVNQLEDKQHIEADLVYSDTRSSLGARVTAFSIGPRFFNGWGYADFAEQRHFGINERSNTEYLNKDDELLFRIFIGKKKIDSSQ